MAPVRFHSVTVWGWNGSSGSGFRFWRFTLGKGFFCVSAQFIDERQITHLICARRKYDLYDFVRGVLGLLPVLFLV